MQTVIAIRAPEFPIIIIIIIVYFTCTNNACTPHAVSSDTRMATTAALFFIDTVLFVRDNARGTDNATNGYFFINVEKNRTIDGDGYVFFCTQAFII